MTPSGTPSVTVSGVGSGFDAWALTRLICPRRVVRAAARDVEGRVVNSYPLVHPVEGDRPATPWAVPLTDRAGAFRLLCVDLDAKGHPDAVARDLARLTGLLDDLAVPHLVCRSGPTGGAHVWLGCSEPVDAALVATLARLLAGWLPTLDPSPLLNPATGCVRPPGAPHRWGGTSRLVAGSLDVLTHPRVTSLQVVDLVTSVAALVAPRPATTLRATLRPIAVDRRGAVFLPGTRRELPRASRLALGTPVTDTTDASAVLWRILCGAAAAHWHLYDVARLVSEPGCEHVRTLRHGTVRVPRPASGNGSPRAVLARQWTRAVTTVSRLPVDRVGDDPTFDPRAGHVARLVRDVQARADAAAGRWQGRRGIADRKVLDAVCLFELQAVRLEVEADVRRIGLTSGLDRETARRALLRLAGDGWLTRTRAASGPRAARWTTLPASSVHSHPDGQLSQAVPRPAGVGAAERRQQLHTLGDRLAAAAHDVFAPRGGLGPEAGALYALLQQPRTTLDLAGRLGVPSVDHAVDRLAGVGLITHDAGHWHHTPMALDALAASVGTAGRGAQRAVTYTVERLAWAWWRAELDQARHALAAPRRPKPRLIGRVHPTAIAPHPRHRNGRADFAEARRLCRQRVDVEGEDHCGKGQRRPHRRPGLVHPLTPSTRSPHHAPVDQ